VERERRLAVAAPVRLRSLLLLFRVLRDLPLA
jgi:hypothetical protein